MPIRHPHIVRLLLATIVFLVATAANATLISRAGGAAYYDDLLGITWLADANYAEYNYQPQVPPHGYGGSMTYQHDPTRYTAVGFIAWLNDQGGHLGATGWRLPTVTLPDPTCGDSASDAWGYGCTGSEMGSLFYTTLGNVQGPVTNSGPFVDIQSDVYWTSTPYQGNPANTGLYGFHWGSGIQNQFGGPGFGGHFVWAVLDGDIATIPEPSTALLLLLGLGLTGLAAKGRRRNRS